MHRVPHRIPCNYTASNKPHHHIISLLNFTCVESGSDAIEESGLLGSGVYFVDKKKNASN